jgi:hypothetical protein
MNARGIVGIAALSALLPLCACSSKSSPSAANTPAASSSTPSSGGTSTPPTSLGGGSICDKGKAYQAQIMALERHALSGGSTSFATYKSLLQRELTTIGADLRQVAPQVPSSLQGDLRTVEAAFTRVEAALSKAKSAHDLQSSLVSLGTDTKLTNAGNALTAWVTSKCKA